MKRNLRWVWVTVALVLEVGLLAAATNWGWLTAVPAAADPATGIAVVEGRHLGPEGWQVRKLETLPTPGRPGDAYAVDLRSKDLTSLNLGNARDTLLNYASFDSQTRWPASLPAGFDPRAILENGKDPGLGIRRLHEQGITGKGVRIAFADQSLLWDHQEYAGRVKQYFTVGKVAGMPEMHGAAVTSLLVGKNTGVAPGADVTYFATQFGLSGNARTFDYLAAAINKVVDDNQKLPPEQRIRVIGASVGPGPSEAGYKALNEAVLRAQNQGVLVVLTSMENWYPFAFSGMDRNPLADPDDVKNYGPGSFYRDAWFANGGGRQNAIFVPMDSRTTAGWFARDGYMYSRFGGESWSVPYAVGIYALVLQVAPKTTPMEFLKAARETGTYTTITQNGKEYRFGPILNPTGLINYFKSK